MTAIEKVGISIEAELNASSFQQSSNQILKYARDTKKQLDQSLYLKLELNVASLQSQLAETKKILAKAKKDGDDALIIKAQIDTNRLQSGLTEAKRQFSNFVNTGDKDLSRLQAKFNQISNDIKSTKISLGGIGDALVGAGLITGINGLAKGIINVASSFETYDAILSNALGSQEKARESFKLLTDISSKTPFSLDEITKSYIKLVNRGIIPTREEIISLGDLASSQGKSFDQLIEAVLDAQTGEFERLKEFGVKASSSGDKVSFTFRGITTTVNKTEGAIKDYILSLGELQGIQGAMETQSATFKGAVSNLGDSIGQLSGAIGSYLLPILTPLVKYVSEIISGFVIWTKENETATKILVGLTTTLALFVGGLGLFSVASGLATASATALGISVGALGTIIYSIVRPIGVAVASLLLLNEAYESNFLGFATFVDGWVEKGRIFTEMARLIFVDVAGYFKDLAKEIGIYIDSITSSFSGLSVAGGVVRSIFDGIINIIKDRIFVVGGLISNLLSLIGKIPGVSNLVNTAKGNITQQKTASLGITSPSAYNPFQLEQKTNSGGLPGAGSTPSKKGGGGGGANKALQEAEKARKEALKQEEEQDKRIKKLKEERFKDIEEKGKKAFDSLTSDIKKSADEVTKLQDKLKGVTDELAGIDQSIAERIISIETDLKTAEGDKRIKLEEELALAKKNIDEKTLATAREEANKSETQKLLDKKNKLEEEKLEIQDKIAFELQQQKDLADAKAKLEEMLTEKYKVELNKRESLLQQSVSRQIKLIGSIPVVGGGAGSGSSVTNNNKTTNINAVINNSVDAESLFNKIA